MFFLLFVSLADECTNGTSAGLAVDTPTNRNLGNIKIKIDLKTCFVLIVLHKSINLEGEQAPY